MSVFGNIWIPNQQFVSGGSEVYIQWTILRLDLVASVRVTDNGNPIANPLSGFGRPCVPASGAPTAVYMCNGLPLVNPVTGYFFWTLAPVGQHTMVFSAYDVSGNLLQAVTETPTVLP
jgi:hypothetical protein